jgi:eukaryotic-like serine/threonine-protein kinase
MAILSGKRLGPYEILSAIGAGGMGEVYRARDTRLKRDVALKILPDHLSDRAELRERFEREARTIASLNHPHICTLYDIGHQDGTDFLVMEYLEGETLAQRLLKGPLPLDQVLQYAIEIADALDKAHRKGITHRDLKPGNIMLTKSGTKLLDFGLAKLKQEVAPANVQLSQLPTANDPLTAQGTIVGTLQYMAPEQLEGKAVDARTDIFAFGAVVYEMATGKEAFDGKTSASVMAKILEVDPPSMSSLQPMTPPALDRLVKKCLAKEPEKRWQAASDVCDELKWIAAGDALPVAPAKGIRAFGRRAALFVAVSGFVATVIVALTVWNLRSVPASPVSRSMFALPPGEQLARLDQPAVALSPDGKHMVYVASRGGVQQLYQRSMDSFETRPIPGTEGGTGPFFSPDSQWVAFFAENELRKVSIGGGAPVTLCNAQGTNGGAWGSNDMIALETGGFGNAHLSVVPAAGGTPQPLTPVDLQKDGVFLQAWPDFLPDAKVVLFEAINNPISSAQTQLFLYVLKTGELRVLAQGGMRPRYAASGHLVYAQGGTLMAVPFDVGRLELKGTPVPVVDGVMEFVGNGSAQYSFSDNGTLAYIPGANLGTQSKLVWVDRKGAEQTLGAPAHTYAWPRVSPDGTRVVVEIGESGGQLWIYELGRDTLTRLTFDGTGNNNPAWTPDGKRVAFTSGAPGNVFWESADGSGKAERLTTSPHRQIPNSWSQDGPTLAFVENNPTVGGQQIWTLRAGEREPKLFLQSVSHQVRMTAPKFSPDGRWLAYASDESGRFEIYLQPYPEPGGKRQVSTDGGTEPVWNPKGRELFYRHGDEMMAVDVTTQPSFAAGKPRVLFQGHYMTVASIPDYDVSADGQHFLMLKADEQAQTPAQINVVLNWFEELKQKVPAGKK